MPAQTVAPLPSGFHIGDYVIDRRIGGGGFSMVYLAFDMDGKTVAIKEYLPDGMVKRLEFGKVAPSSDDKEKSFRHGMKYFFDEGRTLANMRHPNVVEVVNFFRANDTVYMVMKYEQGKTLQRHIYEMKEEPMREGFVRSVFIQLLNGLREVHAQRLLHFDIKPSNIYIRQDGSPVLIDFGAARQTLTAEGTKLPPMYTPGFASPEHHRGKGGVDVDPNLLGPWSDIYSVGASMYACLGGAGPQPADQRNDKDKVVPARRAWSGRYSSDLLDTVDWCMRLNHMERPQSVFALQKALQGEKLPEYRGEVPMFDQLKGALLRLAGR